MSDPPLIAVIITTYNRSAYLKRAIESVFAQTLKPTEFIVVDDGSTDDTGKVLTAYNHLLRVISQPNGGVSSARNRGIHAAKADWIAFLDDDDEFHPTRLQVAAESIRKFPAAPVHASNVAIVDVDGSETDLFALRKRSVQILDQLDRPLEWTLTGCFFVHATVCRREVLVKAGGFRKMFFEDMDLLVRLAAMGAWGIDNRPLLRLIRRPGEHLNLSTQSRLHPRERFRALIEIYRRAALLPELTPRETTVVKDGLATNLFELGRLLLNEGECKGGRQALREAAFVFPRMHSRLKAMCGWLFGTPALRLVSRFERKRHRVLRSTVPGA